MRYLTGCLLFLILLAVALVLLGLALGWSRLTL